MQQKKWDTKGNIVYNLILKIYGLEVKTVANFGGKSIVG